MVFILLWARFKKGAVPVLTKVEPLSLGGAVSVVLSMLPPILLIFSVLGSIFFGIATPTEASGVGAACTIFLAIVKGKFSFTVLKEVSVETMKTTGFIFAIILGATAFSLVFRGLVFRSDVRAVTWFVSCRDDQGQNRKSAGYNYTHNDLWGIGIWGWGSADRARIFTSETLPGYEPDDLVHQSTRRL